MSAKAVLVLCAQALFIQSALSQCTSRAAVEASVPAPCGWAGPGPLAGPGLAYNGLAAPGLAAPGLATPGLAYAGLAPGLEFSATRGGALPVTSSSAIAPTGISVVSENVFEGALSVAGELPFVGTTGMEGALPSAGAGAINHACGDGQTAMISEATIAPTGAVFANAAFTPAIAGAGLAPGLGFGPAGLGPAGLAPANRLGLGGCGRGALY